MSTQTITTWRIHVPTDKETRSWGIFVIDSTGYFSVVSDLGNYAFGWWHHGEQDFRRFLVSLYDDYIMSKLGKRDQVDMEATVESIKSSICERRRHGSLNQSGARAEWDLVEGLESGAYTLEEWMRFTAFRDSWESACYTYDSDLRYFVERLWPRFVDMLEGQLRWEESQAVWLEGVSA